MKSIDLIFIILIIIAVLSIYMYRLPAKIEEMPEFQLGITLQEMITAYGSPYARYNSICIWKNSKWIALCCFSADQQLEQYGIFDLHLRYTAGTISSQTAGRVCLNVLKENGNSSSLLYETGSGYSEYGMISKSGAIIYGSNLFNLAVIDPNNASYTSTPVLLYLLTHPLSFWL